MSDEFLKVQRDIEDALVPRRAHPKGWEPGVDTAKGTLTVRAGRRRRRTGRTSSASWGWTRRVDGGRVAAGAGSDVGLGTTAADVLLPGDGGSCG
jgi:D-lyxose ketol-isomerase